MILLYEDKFINLSWRDFSRALCELLSKTDKIEKASEYVTRYIEPYQDTAQKRKEYAMNPKIIEIKKDINNFAKRWVKCIRSLDNVTEVRVNPSPCFGLSEYVYLDIGISNPKLQGFYDAHPEKYNSVKFRFTDHGDIEEIAAQKSDGQVEYEDRSFLEVSDEMKAKIDNYLKELHNEERAYLKKLKNKERNKKRKLKKKLQKQNALNNNDNLSSVEKETTESLKLRLPEGVQLNEKLEEVADSTYVTDSATDIANWLINKPKPYRIIYDKKYDVWCIADAMKQTHKDMSIDLFDSDYLYGVAKDLDSDIETMRKDFNSGYTDAEVYSDFQFDHYYIKGLFFIPKNMNYHDYEESGFYSHEVPITSGTIFVQYASEFSESGIFKDLYKKLDRMDALIKSLKKIYLECRKEYGENWLDYFYDEAEEWEYDEDEVQEFLDRYGIVGILK